MASPCPPGRLVLGIQNTFIHACSRSAAAARARSAPCGAARERDNDDEGRDGIFSVAEHCNESWDQDCIEPSEAEDGNASSDQLDASSAAGGRRHHPRKGNRPCKGQRTKFRRWREAVAQQVVKDPSGIDLDRLERPSFFSSSGGASDERKWRKVILSFERLRDEVATTRDERSF